MSTDAGAPAYPVRIDGELTPAAQPLAVDRQVGCSRSRTTSCSRSCGSRSCVVTRRRVLRDPLHGPLPARALRLQRRRAALDLARRLLLLRRAGHRPLPAVLAARRPRVPGAPRRRVPGVAVARARAREVVAARDPAVHRGRDLRRRRVGASERRRQHVGRRSRTAASSACSCSSPGIVLLFTGRYPRAIFDFVLGMNRWCYRVVGVRDAHDRHLPAVPPRPGQREPGTAAAELEGPEAAPA